jgi:molecular chaperone IbpA
MEDMIMRTTLDFSPYRRSSIGFDRLFDLLENASRAEQGDSYPPFDVEQRGDDAYRITLAVAGFTSDEIDITSKPNSLVITGRKAEETGATYLHRGIASRAFERQFQLADHVFVTGAELTDGLLRVDLKRELPEAVKPRKIAIGNGSAPAPRTIEQSNDDEPADRKAA